MKNKISIVKKNPKELVWIRAGQLTIEIDLPVMIDSDGFVLLGNSLYEKKIVNSEIDCIVISPDKYLMNVLIGLEAEFVENSSGHNQKNVEADIKRYLKDFTRNYEKLSLFEYDEIIEKGVINKENYIVPPAYNFVKAKEKEDCEATQEDLLSLEKQLESKGGIDTDESLFGNIRE